MWGNTTMSLSGSSGYTCPLTFSSGVLCDLNIKVDHPPYTVVGIDQRLFINIMWLKGGGAF
jgi:hypothetical protein